MSDPLHHLALVQIKTRTQTVKSDTLPQHGTRVPSSEGTAPPTESSGQRTVSHWPPPLLFHAHYSGQTATANHCDYTLLAPDCAICW